MGNACCGQPISGKNCLVRYTDSSGFTKQTQVPKVPHVSKLRKAAASEWHELNARYFKLFVEADRSKVLDTDLAVKLYFASKGPHILAVDIPKPNQFPGRQTAQRLSPYVVKLLSKESHVYGCGYLLTSRHVLTSTSCVRTVANLTRYKSVMYYDEKKGTEVTIEIDPDVKLFEFPEQNAVVFELKSDAHHFKPYMFSSKPNLSSDDDLELLSASLRDPGLQSLKLDDVEVKEDFINYKPLKAKERVGGLIYSKDKVVALHVNHKNEDERGEAIQFSALIEEWSRIVADQDEGFDIFIQVLGRSIFPPSVASSLPASRRQSEAAAPDSSDSSSSSKSNDTSVDETADGVPFEFKDFSNCAIMLVLGKNQLHIFDPTTQKSQVQALPRDEQMDYGYSLIGTEKGVILSGTTNRGNNAVWVFNGELFQMPYSMYQHNKHGSIVFQDKLYLIAGFKSQTVERLDFQTNCWSEVAPLSKYRYDFACATHEDSIYVVGGVRGIRDDAYTKSIERFCDDSWSILGFSMSLRAKKISLWNRGRGRFVVFGGLLPNAEFNDGVYHVNLEKERCHMKTTSKSLKDCNNERYTGYDGHHCFTMQNEGRLLRYDSHTHKVARFNLTSD